MKEWIPIISFLCLGITWRILCQSHSLSNATLNVGLFILLFMAFQIYNHFCPKISRYFRLVGRRHAFHLQKDVLSSAILFCTHQPSVILLKLYKDLRKSAIPKALELIPEGSTLVIETHLTTEKLLTKIPGAQYETFTPSLYYLIMPRFFMWLTGITRFLIGKGWYQPTFHVWYRVSLRKSGSAGTTTRKENR